MADLRVGSEIVTADFVIVTVDSGTEKAGFATVTVDSVIEMVGFVTEKVVLPSMEQLLTVVEIEKERGEAYQMVQVCHLSVVFHIIERAEAKFQLAM